MVKFAVCMLGFLAAIPLQCNRKETRAAGGEHHDHHAPAAKDVVQLSQASCDIVGIKVAQVQDRQTRQVLKAMGKIVAPQPQTAIVGYPYSARVGKIHVLIGDWVKKGQILVTLESQEVGNAKSEFFKAIADLELAKLNFEREKELLKGEVGKGAIGIEKLGDPEGSSSLLELLSITQD